MNVEQRIQALVEKAERTHQKDLIAILYHLEVHASHPKEALLSHLFFTYQQLLQQPKHPHVKRYLAVYQSLLELSLSLDENTSSATYTKNLRQIFPTSLSILKDLALPPKL